MTSPATSKVVLRESMRRRLAALEPAAREAGAAAVAARVLALPETSSAGLIFCCLSFGDEIDTHRLIERLIADGRQVCVPRCVAAPRALTVHRYPCALETLAFGLRQPKAGTPALEPAAIDLALIVGLAFDRRGFRLGHGGGYFDRFLAAHHPPAIGLAYDFQRLDRLPAEAHDVALERVVTPGGVWRGAASGS